MGSGLRNLEPALPENDENYDGATTTSLAIQWMKSPNPNSKTDQVALKLDILNLEILKLEMFRLEILKLEIFRLETSKFET